MELTLALIIIAAAIYFMVRGEDVRLVLFAAGLALTSLALEPWRVLDEFRKQMVYGDIVGPLCAAVGYAYVLRATGCDREMVRLLIKPVRRVPWLLVPAGCVVGFVTNIAITSQTGSAAAVGPVLAPLMLAAGLHPVIVAATLVLGCSGGGNMLNAGDGYVLTIASASGAPVKLVLERGLLPLLASFTTAVAVFTWASRRFAPAPCEAKPVAEPDESQPVNLLKALMPPLPVLMIVALLPGVNLVHVSLESYEKGMPVVHAMLISTILVLLVHRRDPSKQTKEFFDGMGYAYINIISLIIAASCFVEGLSAVGLTQKLVSLVHGSGFLGKLASVVFPGSLAVLSGSALGPSAAFSKAVLPALGVTNLTAAVDLGVLGALSATLGRTISPVAAVVIFAASLVGVTPLQLVKRTAPPLAVAAVVLLLVAWVR